MNNYLNEVRKYLSQAGVPAEDADDMLEYFEEYFYDAGMTDERAIAKYGKPKRFAQFMAMDYLMEADDRNLSDDSYRPKEKARGRFHLVWMIIVGLCASPILLPLAFGAVMVIFGLLISVLAVIFSAYTVVVACIGAGAVSFIVGSTVLLQDPATSIASMGAGLFILGIGLLIAPFLMRFSRWLFNLFMTFIKWLGRKALRSRRYQMPNRSEY